MFAFIRNCSQVETAFVQNGNDVDLNVTITRDNANGVSATQFKADAERVVRTMLAALGETTENRVNARLGEPQPGGPSGTGQQGGPGGPGKRAVQALETLLVQTTVAAYSPVSTTPANGAALVAAPAVLLLLFLL